MIDAMITVAAEVGRSLGANFGLRRGDAQSAFRRLNQSNPDDATRRNCLTMAAAMSDILCMRLNS